MYHQLARLVQSVARRTEPGHLVFPYTTDDFRRLFHACTRRLGLSPEYVPHSLRHGGATRMFLQRAPMQDIMERGRWESAKSCRTYLQTMKALLLSMEVPPAVYDAGVFASLD